MSIVQMFIIAVGLATDAFAVSVSAGLRMREVSRWQMVRISAHFGLFHEPRRQVPELAGGPTMASQVLVYAANERVRTPCQ